MGAGKTTLSLELANYLQGPYIGWEDFDEISKGPEDYIDWFQRGEDYSEWDYPRLAEVLKSKADFFINGSQSTKKQVEVIREYLRT